MTLPSHLYFWTKTSTKFFSSSTSTHNIDNTNKFFTSYLWNWHKKLKD